MTVRELISALEMILAENPSELSVFAESVEADILVRRVEVKKVYTSGFEPKVKVVLGP